MIEQWTQPSPMQSKAHAGHVLIVEDLETWFTNHEPRVVPDREQGQRPAGRGRWLVAVKGDTALGRPHFQAQAGFLRGHLYSPTPRGLSAN